MRLHLLVSSRSKEAKYTERFPDGILKTLEQIQSEKDYKEKFTFDYRYDAKHLPLIFGYVMNGKVLNCDDKESGKEDQSDSEKNKPTVKNYTGGKVNIFSKDYQIEKTRKLIAEKLKAGSANLTIEINTTPEHMKNLKGLKLSAKGQGAWTIGDHFNCDIVLPKYGYAYGTLFSVVHHEG